MQSRQSGGFNAVTAANQNTKAALEGEASAQASNLTIRSQQTNKTQTYAMRPEVIVLDEPTAMLDPSGRREVIETIKYLNKHEGITVVHITHYMEEAVDADKVIVMEQGKIVLQGTPEDVFSQVEVLKGIGLDVPQVTELAYRLRVEGLDVPQNLLRVEEMVNAICQL